MEQYCQYCKNKIKITPYFFNQLIETTKRYSDNGKEEIRYNAKVQFSFICPYCGKTNQSEKERELDKKDIVNLIVGY